MRKNVYANLQGDEAQNHFDNFIIDSWSYSKVGTFARNEKAFEMQYIYRERSKSSASTIAGSAYHASLEQFFLAFKEGHAMDIVELERIAFDFINETPANYWKLQKTTPTIDKCIEVATKTVAQLLSNFVGELNTYIEHIDEILEVESKYTEWVNINGVDIPIPCHARLDKVFKHKNGNIVIVDHKSKRAFTDEKDAKLVVAKQAITYASVYEARTGVYPDEVWIMENKYSKNKDGSPQIVPIVVKLDKDTRRLYEALLYEPLRSMIQAISDPDHVYLINDNDSFQDKAEIFDFWCRTMIAEVDDFDIPEDKKEMVENRLRKIRNSDNKAVAPSVIKNFKKAASSFITYDLSNKDMTNSEKITHVLRSFGKLTEVEHELTGYSSTTYLLNVSAGVPIKSFFNHNLDIANALNVNKVRFLNDLQEYKGKSYLSIEVPIKEQKMLRYDEKYLNGLKIPIGLDNFGNVIYWNFENPSTPHAIIAGATGSGKSVCTKTVIEYALASGVDDIHILDPKYEFKYNNPKVNICNDIEDIETTMEMLVEEMEARVKSGVKKRTLVILEEFADSFANSRSGKELNIYENIQIGEYKNGLPKMKKTEVGKKASLATNLQKLAQKGRSSGFNIILTTQHPSVDVVSGKIKANFPVRICFRTAQEVNSRVVLDEPGAEGLSGNGDGLIKSPEYLSTIRFQGFFKE